MPNATQVRWKLDENEELSYAVIEDTEDGLCVHEYADRSETTRRAALRMIEAHNYIVSRAT